MPTRCGLLRITLPLLLATATLAAGPAWGEASGECSPTESDGVTALMDLASDTLDSRITAAGDAAALLKASEAYEHQERQLIYDRMVALGNNGYLTPDGSEPPPNPELCIESPALWSCLKVSEDPASNEVRVGMRPASSAGELHWFLSEDPTLALRIRAVVRRQEEQKRLNGDLVQRLRSTVQALIAADLSRVTPSADPEAVRPHSLWEAGYHFLTVPTDDLPEGTQATLWFKGSSLVLVAETTNPSRVASYRFENPSLGALLGEHTTLGQHFQAGF